MLLPNHMDPNAVPHEALAQRQRVFQTGVFICLMLLLMDPRDPRREQEARGRDGEQQRHFSDLRQVQIDQQICDQIDLTFARLWREQPRCGRCNPAVMGVVDVLVVS